VAPGIWNLPNALTVLRLLLLPIIVFLLWPGSENRERCFWAAVVYAIGGILDIVDGYWARRYGQVTVFGKFFDPLVDKLFFLGTLIALLSLPGPRVPALFVLIMLTRELAITGLRGIAASEGVVIAAGDRGKVKTTLGTIGTIGLLLHYPTVVDFGFAALPVDFHRVGVWVLALSVIYSISSGYQYTSAFLRAR
jgi:CDP-diacylglycerol--glycerol-3-phosphate 3-phosphatidyltransferase